MLKDYCHICPSAMHDKEAKMDQMNHIYNENPSITSLNRLLAYKNGHILTYNAQGGLLINCDKCGAHSYHVGSNSPICRHCNNNLVELDEISIEEIPPTVDIDKFYWYEPNWGNYVPP